MATVIDDGLGSYRLGFFWDRDGLGSFGNKGEGLGENRKKTKQIGSWVFIVVFSDELVRRYCYLFVAKGDRLLSF